MLDIKFIRENLDIIKRAAQKKNITIDLDRLISVDDSRRSVMQAMEEKKAEQNKVGAQIAQAESDTQRTIMLGDMQVLKADIQKDEETLKPIMKEWQELMLQVPQVPDMTVPDGDSDEDNEEVKVWGDKTRFNFDAKDH